jgi:hypothetical protein
LPSQREEQQKELHWHFRKAYLYQDNFAKATTLESVITAGNYSLVADYNSILKLRVKMELNPF